ncbi:MAG TPA: hypothetical protein VFX29_04345 [Longimicrobiaceae bacterium]|jgi:hypothetical protein|nr:hypothetical protein [Longimicrobiaceae bacterium]
MRVQRFLAVPVVAFALALGACTAQKTQEGELPKVDVEGGQLPKYDVEPAKVEVGTDTHTVVTPDVNIVPADSTRP